MSAASALMHDGKALAAGLRDHHGFHGALAVAGAVAGHEIEMH